MKDPRKTHERPTKEPRKNHERKSMPRQCSRQGILSDNGHTLKKNSCPYVGNPSAFSSSHIMSYFSPYSDGNVGVEYMMNTNSRTATTATKRVHTGSLHPHAQSHASAKPNSTVHHSHIDNSKHTDHASGHPTTRDLDCAHLTCPVPHEKGFFDTHSVTYDHKSHTCVCPGGETPVSTSHLKMEAPAPYHR